MGTNVFVCGKRAEETIARGAPMFQNKWVDGDTRTTRYFDAVLVIPNSFIMLRRKLCAADRPAYEPPKMTILSDSFDIGAVSIPK